MTRRAVPFGDRAVLIELDDLVEVLGLYAALDRTRPAGVVDVVPAARTVAIMVDPARLPISVATAWAIEAPIRESAAGDGRSVEIAVRYDGDDLAEVAALLGISQPEVVARHTSSEWRVAFGGFAPGFAYLVTDHDGLVVPRRPAARQSVPAGAVGLAGEFSGIYPRTSPGGWQLIGSTDAVLWDSASETPALLTPGTRVRFTVAR